MLNKFLFASLLVTTTSVFANDPAQSAIMKDDDKAMDKQTWLYAAAAPKGLTKVREFHDMGAAGVQQLDYVVNCATGKLALASFKVLTAMNPGTGRATEPSVDSVSFYKPVIQHDINITENVCGSSLASNAKARVN
jgi:hypothetical protein